MMNNVIKFPIQKYRQPSHEDKLSLLEQFVHWEDQLKNYKTLSLSKKIEAMALLEKIKDFAETQELRKLMIRHMERIRKTF